MFGFTCCMPGCYNSVKHKGIGFYVFPKDPKLRDEWVQKINRVRQSDRIGVSESMVSSIWITWLDVLNNRLIQVRTLMPHSCATSTVHRRFSPRDMTLSLDY
ncbi:uncharacterized protein LOC144149245 [Haemaphysalis longicornis]